MNRIEVSVKGNITTVCLSRYPMLGNEPTLDKLQCPAMTTPSNATTDNFVRTIKLEMRNSTFSARDAIATMMQITANPYHGLWDHTVFVIPKEWRKDAESLVSAVEYTNTQITNMMKYSIPRKNPQFFPRYPEITPG